mmetsp:Transcript_28404/g.76944  ORF Transcript_28404/g.76944 Transcript_28404/m.76944 type:complete len:252 (+) Transcript_28404:105-860(+)
MKVPPTLNPSWTLATALCVWFLFIHTPVFLLHKDNIEPLLWVHFVGVYSVYLACVHNTLLTPSTFGGAARPFHVWGGRIGLVLGVVGFSTGMYLTWILLDPTDDLGFSIGITYGGIAQVQLEVIGYRAIVRYKAVKERIQDGDYTDREELLALEDELDDNLIAHVIAMVNLFVMACGIPALIRLGARIGNVYLLPLIAATYCLGYFMTRPILTRMKAKRLAERCGGQNKEEEPFRYSLLNHTQYSNLANLS